MRPINRGPGLTAYIKYDDAKQDLTNALGSYCSYCERRIQTLLAVEHIQPKALLQYAHLECEWTNFLLACVNCNSAKRVTPVECDQFVLPDRDNTFAAFVYQEDGFVDVSTDIPTQIQTLALATRELLALNRYEFEGWSEVVVFSALERLGQRMQAWVQAKEARSDYEAGLTTARAVSREASGVGFFSIWMAAFEGLPAVRQELISIFPGTAVDCFDQMASPVSPRPTNGLPYGGKV